MRRSNTVPAVPDPPVPKPRIPPPLPGEKALTRRETAEELRVSPTQVDRMAAAGAPFVDVGFHAPGKRPAAHRRFFLSQVLTWLQERRS